MAITSLNNVKTILGITTTESDDYITALIPLVEDDYLSIRNKDFDKDEHGNTIYPSGSEMTAIRMIGYLMERKENNNLGEGIKSETISRYSVTYSGDNSTQFGYPKGLVGSIKRFARFY